MENMVAISITSIAIPLVLQMSKVGLVCLRSLFKKRYIECSFIFSDVCETCAIDVLVWLEIDFLIYEEICTLYLFSSEYLAIMRDSNDGLNKLDIYKQTENKLDRYLGVMRYSKVAKRVGNEEKGYGQRQVEKAIHD